MVPAERHALGQIVLSAKVERVTGPAQPDCAHRGESPMAYCTHLSKRTSELRRMLSLTLKVGREVVRAVRRL